MKYIKLFEDFKNVTYDVWYHGSDNKFDEFNEPNDMTRPAAKLGIWFTNDMEFSEFFGENIIKAKLRFTNPYIISLEEWDEMRSEHAKDTVFFSNLRQSLIDDGYDSFYVKGKDEMFAGTKVNTPDVVAVFSKSQITIISSK